LRWSGSGETRRRARWPPRREGQTWSGGRRGNYGGRAAGVDSAVESYGTFLQMGEALRPTAKSRPTVGRTQVRFGYSCSAAGECAAETVFCYTAENSHHLEAQITSKNPQFQEEKISERRKARSQKTIFLCLVESPQEGYPRHPHPFAQRYRTFYTWRAGKCDPQMRFLLAGFTRGGGGGGGGGGVMGNSGSE
jgi:hypothetical protein